MKKWEQLQLTLDNSKSEELQSDYEDKTSRVNCVYEFPKFSPQI